jgi:hypothetical protein
MSSEKRYEHIENKIKEAAENNHIIFDEKAWKKMEVLLDKEDKKRPFFWLWFLAPIALLSIYGLFMLSKSNDKTLAKNSDDSKIEKINTIIKETKQIPTIEKKIESEESIATLNNDTKIEKVNTTTSTKTQIPAAEKKIVSGVNNATSNSINANNTKHIVKVASSIKKQSEKANTLNAFNTKNTKPKFSTSDESNKEKENYLAKNKTNVNQIGKTKTSIKNAGASEDEIVFEKTTSNKK